MTLLTGVFSLSFVFCHIDLRKIGKIIFTEIKVCIALIKKKKIETILGREEVNMFMELFYILIFKKLTQEIM